MRTILALKLTKDIIVFLIVSFIAHSSSYLLLAHFKHSLFDSSQASRLEQQDLYSVANDMYNEKAEQQAPITGGCGCPGCCAVS